MTKTNAEKFLHDLIIGDDDTRQKAHINLDILIADATAGIAEAQYQLGRMYSQFGGKIHHVDAVQWMRRAAKQGHTDAQIELGNAYHLGRGVALDRDLGNEWIFLAKRTLASAEESSVVGNSGNETDFVTKDPFDRL